MPSFKIDTAPLNQYNRKRISQSKISFEPVKIVFHDVADGKTLKFWEMYYRYYFGDGNEPGQNTVKEVDVEESLYSTEELISKTTSAYSSNVAGSPASVTRSTAFGSSSSSPVNMLGQKRSTSNIIQDRLDNHIFGFNLENVENVRDLIQTINIYQVHAGRFNQITLVNPRIATFNHDTLNYASGDKTLELTFTFEYEYAYYTIQNMELGAGEENNQSSKEPFTHGEFLDFPQSAFNAEVNYIQSDSQRYKPNKGNFTNKKAKNKQTGLGVVSRVHTQQIHAPLGEVKAHRGNVRPNNNMMTALSAMLHLKPTIYAEAQQIEIKARSFASKALSNTPFYIDTRRNKIRY